MTKLNIRIIAKYKKIINHIKYMFNFAKYIHFASKLHVPKTNVVINKMFFLH